MLRKIRALAASLFLPHRVCGMRTVGIAPSLMRRVLRPVSVPIIYSKSYKIVLALDRSTNNEIVIIEGGNEIFGPIGEWAFRTMKNPCGAEEGCDWEIGVPLFGGTECRASAGGKLAILTPENERIVNSAWPPWNRLGKECFRRFKFICGEKLAVPDIVQDEQEPMFPPHPRCASCGKCCLLFVDVGCGGVMPSGIMTRGQWFEFFHSGRSGYGVDRSTESVKICTLSGRRQ